MMRVFNILEWQMLIISLALMSYGNTGIHLICSGILLIATLYMKDG